MTFLLIILSLRFVARHQSQVVRYICWLVSLFGSLDSQASWQISSPTQLPRGRTKSNLKGGAILIYKAVDGIEPPVLSRLKDN
ncbi:hypothetical protein B0H16DRAFT_1571017 [Mycena metata]|uniref:Secreted protein n=1 Tax=Mycena metata TaxID=1033252 RepID=A0AAD7MZZ8_9AGAR|nr:hypothetical protein B0H16DRAFT_1571017 [Mycena metata]